MAGPTIDLATAFRQLVELVDEAARFGEVLLTRRGEVVAKIVPVQSARAPRRPGSARGKIHVADDFATTPADFDDHV